ncbi:MAG: hypothetical protein AAGA22_03155 [Pseudomonadota bacterium]
MRPDLVVLLKPSADSGSGLIDGGEPFRVQHFVAERAVEPFIVAVFTRRPLVDPDGLDADQL